MRSNSTGLLKNIILSLVSTAIFFSAAELLCRLHYTPRQIIYNGPFEYDKDKIYALKRNYTGEFVGKALATNSFGYRDTEIPIKKNNTTVRILCVGDSVTFGHGVLAEETYPERLESILNQRFGQYHFDCINTAVPGNAAFQEYYDLKRGLLFEPDIVIIQFVLNDVLGPYRVFKRYGGKGVDYHGVEDISYLHYFFSQRSAFYLFLNTIYARIRLQARTHDELKTKMMAEAHKLDLDAAAYAPDSLKVQEAWRECLKWEQKIVDVCKKHGIDCVILISPCDFQVLHPEYTYAQQVIKDFAKRNNIVSIDLLSCLKESAGQKTLRWYDYFLDYDHYNPKGHLFVAKTAVYPVICEILKKKKLVSQCNE